MNRRVEILEIQEFDETTTEQMDQRPMITAAFWILPNTEAKERLFRLL